MAERIGGAGGTGLPRKGGAVKELAKGRAVGAKPGKDVMTEGSLEVTLEELRDFLDADHIEVSANPEFKESLREKLWALVQLRSRRRSGERP
jgi:hypothetical protein